jgi:8-oxo-dGTP pyrophosphatase MutT (NUDIX family)
MRTIDRDIVGGFIFSSDNKVLLGKNKKGGVYEGSYVVPGGGVDDGETNEQALRREMLEETGIDITGGIIAEINASSGAHEKTLRDTGERVFVKMNFYDYKITLSIDSDKIIVSADDDWTSPTWFTSDELRDEVICLPTTQTLKKIGFLAD